MSETGFAPSGDARICFETAGEGDDFVMIHAGVADRRQWNAAFEHFQKPYRVLRYDMRGYGDSEPVSGAYRAIDDLCVVLDAAGMRGKKIMMGCSMGGSLAMDFTLTHPHEVQALIMVCSGPSGLSLDVDEPEEFAQVMEAERAGDWDRVCELETRVWFDGRGRSPADVDPSARALLFDMNRRALEYGRLDLGKRERDATPAAYKRLAEIEVPVLIVTGALDVPFMAGAAEVMRESIRNSVSVEFADAAHLPNMEHPDRFNVEVGRFLESL